MCIHRIVFVLFLAIGASVVTAQQQADLGVQKSGPDSAPAGSDVSYTVTIFNAGPDAATDAVLSDPVPAGMSFVSATQTDGPAFTCDTTVNCTIASFPAFASATFTFVFHIDSGTGFLNTVTASSKTFDPNSENDSGSIFTGVAVPTADLSLAKSATSPTAAPDTDVTFLITLMNNGPDAATDVLLTDNLPAPLTFVSFTQTSGPAMSCGTSTCTAASFPAFATATFSLTGHVPAGTPALTEITNTATVASDSDPLDENDAATTTVVVSAADVRIEKTGPANAVAGTTITYEVTVTNDGPDAALNVTIDDPQLCQVVNCNLGMLFPGQSVILSGDVLIPPDATSWSNTAIVATDSIDPNLANNSATVPTAITQSADVHVEKTGAATIDAGSQLTYTITVTNDGPSTASNVVLADTLPAGTTLVSSSCGANPCAIGALAPNAPLVITLTVAVPPDASGTLVNTATATSDTPDPDPTNDSATATTNVTQSADLRIEKTGPATAAATTDVTYTITVTNDGPSDASDVVVTDTLPAGTTFVSSSCGANPCIVGTLVANASFVVTLVANVDLNATGPLVDTATATSSTPDPAAANNTATFETAVGAPPADLSITKSADYETAVVGTNVTYTIVVTNNGPGAATDVVVTDDLPAGATLFSSSAGCTGTTTVTCAVGTLAAGSSATIELVVTLSTTPGTVTNTARVSTSSDDPGADNDSASAAIAAHLPAESVPTLSPLALAFLALTIASTVLVMLRRVS